MFRIVITCLWAAICTALVFAASDSIFVSLASAGVYACVIGATMWGADTVRLRQDNNAFWQKRTAVRLGLWFALYEVVPAALIFAAAQWCGLFHLPYGFATALAMCLPCSLPAVSGYVDTSWLSR